MTIVCQNCSTRLQIDDDKAPAGAFTVRCPKCKKTVNSGAVSPASDQGATALGGSPATEHPRYDQATAPAYQLATVSAVNETTSNEEAVRLLMSLLSKGEADTGSNPNRRSAWNKRKGLVCAGQQYREQIAKGLTENGYHVYVAEDTRQAVETMRANQLELVVLEPQFDVAEQGAAFVVREINVLRPAQRRRLFFTLLSPSLRTMDAHAAFLNNVNAIVNINDVGDLPRILELAFREYNELYRELNQAFNLGAL
ncbi:MAG TPA: zinc-ribbon domain-containing protein [Pyrinomonadaceae bacterium]